MQKLRVLIAEDDPITRTILKSLVTQWGHEVLAVPDGGQAREALRRENFALCIFDWMMPCLSGLELCSWVKSGALLPAPCVVLLTARTSPEDARAGYAAGADDYMTKPLDRGQLHACIDKLVARMTRSEITKDRMANMDPIDQYRHDIALYNPRNPYTNLAEP